MSAKRDAYNNSLILSAISIILFRALTALDSFVEIKVILILILLRRKMNRFCSKTPFPMTNEHNTIVHRPLKTKSKSSRTTNKFCVMYYEKVIKECVTLVMSLFILIYTCISINLFPAWNKQNTPLYFVSCWCYFLIPYQPCAQSYKLHNLMT